MHYFPVTVSDNDSALFERFLVTEFPTGESVRYILEKLYSDISTVERIGASIILRPSVKRALEPIILNEIFSTENVDARKFEPKYKPFIKIRRDIKKAFKRFPDTNIYILVSCGYQHFLSKNINLLTENKVCAFNQDNQLLILSAMQKAEMDYLVEKGKCKLPPLGKNLYRVPAGAVVKSFLRVGNLQTTRAAIDALFFWLLPHLEHCVGIVTDTWSISSISQNISRRLATYNDNIQPPCPIEMLGEYHSDLHAFSEDASEIIDRFLRRINPPNRSDKHTILILLSATHTGAQLDLLDTSLSSRRINKRQAKFVSIFRLSETSNIPTLRDYSDNPDFQPQNNSETFNRFPLSIDGTIHFPITVMDINKMKFLPQAESYIEFAKSYSNICFAKVHYTDKASFPTGYKHHTVWIDTLALVNHATFKERFKSKLLGLKPTPTIIIYPSHDPANRLVKICKSVFDHSENSVGYYCQDDLKLDPELVKDDELLCNHISGLGTHESVLILDDAFVTGRRITSYQKNLRDFDCKAVLHYLVAIARPDNDNSWKTSKRAFASARGDETNANHSNSFEYVENLILPDWSRDKCPWCIETSFANKSATNFRDAIEETGLVDNLFLSPPGMDNFTLNPGSFLGPTGLPQASIFCMVSGVLQKLRTSSLKDNKPFLGEQALMSSTVLHSDYYLRYFTDSVLVASFMRGLQKEEMVYQCAEKEARRTKKIQELCFDNTKENLALEILFAYNMGKIPCLDLSNSELTSRYSALKINL